jgi:hypothetical protein
MMKIPMRTYNKLQKFSSPEINQSSMSISQLEVLPYGGKLKKK